MAENYSNLNDNSSLLRWLKRNQLDYGIHSPDLAEVQTFSLATDAEKLPSCTCNALQSVSCCVRQQACLKLNWSNLLWVVAAGNLLSQHTNLVPPTVSGSVQWTSRRSEACTVLTVVFPFWSVVTHINAGWFDCRLEYCISAELQ
jgi:hypothetical protein